MVNSYYCYGGNSGTKKDLACDFNVLFNVPQFDQEKVKLFIENTNDFVGLLRSWFAFWSGTNSSKYADVIALEKFGSYAAKYETDYRKLFVRINELLEFKLTLKGKVEEHFRAQDLVVQKWRDINKNFLVLNELAKRRMKI